jgi:hypothetical protein
MALALWAITARLEGRLYAIPHNRLQIIFAARYRPDLIALSAHQRCSIRKFYTAEEFSFRNFNFPSGEKTKMLLLGSS